MALAAPSADELLGKAREKATKEGKSIFVDFSASWWGWCKRLDKFIEHEEIKPIFDRYFVVVQLVVNESEKNKHLENAGGVTIMEKFGGRNAGLPFFAFVDARGELIVNSKRPTDGEPAGSNIGHPFAPEEIAWFMKMLNKAAPKMTQAEAQKIETWLKQQKK
jgi:hypothetical protein